MSQLRLITHMSIVLNLVAAFLLSVVPALEPCRLGSLLGHSHTQEQASDCHDCCGNDDREEPAGPLPDCPDACDHLTDAAGIQASLVQPITHEVLPLPPLLATPLRSVAEAQFARSSHYHHPPPSFSDLDGVARLRI